MHGFKSYFPSSLYTPTAASAVADAKRGAAPFAAPVAGFAPSNFQLPPRASWRLRRRSTA